MCKVLNVRTRGRAANAIYIGRGSRWGSLFRFGVDGDRAQVIERHERWLRDQHEFLRALPELKGRDVVRFCAPSPCHGDMRLANAPRNELIAWWHGAS